MTEKLKKLKYSEAKKAHIISRLQKVFSFGENLVNESEVQQLLIQFAQVQNLKKALTTLVEQISEAIPDGQEFDLSSLNRMEGLSVEITGIADNLQSTNQKENSPPPSEVRNGHVSRLPEEPLPIFSDEIKDWTLFKECFENLIHNKSDLSNIEKINYLIGCISEINEVQRLFHGHDGDVHRRSLSAIEHQVNGNSRSLMGHENCGSLHRDKSLLSFYSRIPPLGKNASNSEGKIKEISEAKLLALYDNYKDLNSPEFILAEGVERLLSDLNLSPDEFKVLVLAWRLNAETMCQFSKEEFLNGFKTMRSDSIKSISATLPEICKEVLNDPELFKDLYRFTFRFGLDKTTGERILPSDMAICLWKIVFSMKEPPILERWLKFLESHPNIRGIPCDTWNMFLNLIDTVGNDLSSYDDSEAWPSIFDDFVEYENDQMNQNIYKEKEEIIQDWV